MELLTDFATGVAQNATWDLLKIIFAFAAGATSMRLVWRRRQPGFRPRVKHTLPVLASNLPTQHRDLIRRRENARAKVERPHWRYRLTILSFIFHFILLVFVMAYLRNAPMPFEWDLYFQFAISMTGLVYIWESLRKIVERTVLGVAEIRCLIFQLQTRRAK